MRKSRRMVDLVREYVAYRTSLGFHFKSAASLLLRFAEYADEKRFRGPLTTELAVRWVRLPAAASPGYLATRLTAVRGFAKYRAIFDPRTEIPSKGLLGSAYRRRTPHIYSDVEVSALLNAARRLSPANGLRPHTYATFFGLLACTGLRVSEALKLARSDIDWRQGMLTIRQTKFRKSRFVPLHGSTTRALKKYAGLRDRIHPSSAAESFFISSRGTPLALSTVEVLFGRLRKQLSWRDHPGKGRPRIHDFRHTFACRRLLRWYQEGADVEYALPALSTYLGHTGVAQTYWYLTGIPELLELAAQRFERFASFDSGDRP
jgi:integrase